MEGEGPVALDKYEKPDGWPQTHDQGPTDGSCVQGSGVC